MEKGHTFETVVGALVLMVTAFFFHYVYNKSGWKNINGYVLTAKFEHADGLSEGTDVKLGGIRVGKILSTKIDQETFLAIVKFSISGNLKLPKDSNAAVASDGLFGGKYLSITPGGDEESIESGGEITNTTGPLNLESLIGKFMFSSQDKK